MKREFNPLIPNYNWINIILLLFFLIIKISPNFGATCQFTNGGGDGLWSNPANWDCGEVPGIGDIAVTSFFAFDDLILDIDTTVDEFQFADTRIIGNKTLTVGTFLFNNGATIADNVTITVTGNATIEWSNVDDNAILNLNGNTNQNGRLIFRGYAVVNNNGTCTLNGGGDWGIVAEDGYLRNYGTLNINRGGNPFWYYSSCCLKLVNESTGIVNFISGTDHDFNIHLINHGAFNYSTGGFLQFKKYFENYSSAFTVSNHSTFRNKHALMDVGPTIESGSVWEIEGECTFNTDIDVDATTRLIGGTSFIGTIVFRTDTLNWNGGTIENVHFIVDEYAELIGGTLDGGDTLEINGNADHYGQQITVLGSSTLLLTNGTSYNIHTEIPWRSQGTGYIRNHGTMNVGVDGHLIFVYGTGLVFHNEMNGVVNYTGGTSHGIFIPVYNKGTWNYNRSGGLLEFDSYFQNEAMGELIATNGAAIQTVTAVLHNSPTINPGCEWQLFGQTEIEADIDVDGKLNLVSGEPSSSVPRNIVTNELFWDAATIKGKINLVVEGVANVISARIQDDAQIHFHGITTHTGQQLMVIGNAKYVVEPSGTYYVETHEAWRSQGGTDARVVNKGTMYVNSCGSMFYIYGSGLKFYNKGVLGSTANCEKTINVPYFPCGGTEGGIGVWNITMPGSCSGSIIYAPGNSIGTMATNNYIPDSSKVIIELAGYGGGGDSLGHDSLHISGSPAIGDTLEIQQLYGFEVADCPNFTVMTCSGTFSDSFDVVVTPETPNATWTVVYNSNSVELHVEVDADFDGFSTCAMPEGDCDDYDSIEFPGQMWYADDDDDDHGAGPPIVQCERPVGNYFAAVELISIDDCDDDDDLEFPGQTWYPDIDDDNHGSGAFVIQCERPASHHVPAELVTIQDCNDSEPTMFPGNPEICDDLDNDCSGTPESQLNTWVGMVGDTLWHDPTNWSDGFVPLECQDVFIPNGATVVIPAGMLGRCKTLETGLGAIFEVKLTGELDVGN